MGDIQKRILERLKRPIEIKRPKIIALGVLLGLLGAVFALVIQPIISSTSEAQEELDSTVFRIEKIVRSLNKKEDLLKLKEQLRKQNSTDRKLLSTETASMASADLQSKIKQILTDSGAELASLQVLPERTEDPFVRIGVKVRMNSSTSALRSVLYNLETAVPYLFVDYLSVRAVRGVNATGNQDEVDQLNIEFDVVGFMRP